MRSKESPYPDYTPLYPLETGLGRLGTLRYDCPSASWPQITPCLTPPYSVTSTTQVYPAVRDPDPLVGSATGRNIVGTRLHTIGKVCYDVSQQLIDDFLKESYREANFLQSHDPFSGSTLEYLSKSNTLAFSTGATGSQLQFQSLTERYSDWSYSPKHAFLTPIRQLVESYDSDWLGVRTYGGASFLRLTSNVGEGTFIHQVFDDTPTDISFNPVIMGLVSGVNSKLESFIWDLNSAERPEKFLPPLEVDHSIFNIGNARFGLHPRSLIVGTSFQIAMIDSRSKPNSTFIKSSEPGVQFWGFDVAPKDPSLLAVSSSDGLSLYDLRYLHEPIQHRENLGPNVTPSSHVQFLSNVYPKHDVIATWGTKQGLIFYPTSQSSTLEDPFQIPIPGSQQDLGGYNPITPADITPADSEFWGFEPLGNTGLSNLVGVTLVQNIESGNLGCMQMLDSGAIFYQTLSLSQQGHSSIIVNRVSPHLAEAGSKLRLSYQQGTTLDPPVTSDFIEIFQHMLQPISTKGSASSKSKKVSEAKHNFSNTSDAPAMFNPNMWLINTDTSACTWEQVLSNDNISLDSHLAKEVLASTNCCFTPHDIKIDDKLESHANFILESWTLLPESKSSEPLTCALTTSKPKLVAQTNEVVTKRKPEGGSNNSIPISSSKNRRLKSSSSSRGFQ